MWVRRRACAPPRRVACDPSGVGACADPFQVQYAGAELLVELLPIPGQWWAPLRGARPLGARAGAVGLAELVVVGVVVVELAALAIAAPPPTSAPVTRTVVRILCIGFTSFCSFEQTIADVRLSYVGVR